MAVRSVFLSEPSIGNNSIHIGGEEHRHLMVARAGIGETIEVFDGKGNVWTTIVDSIGKHETIARITESRKADADPVELILGLALIRIGAFELALEKAVEVGVTRIVPFTAGRSNPAPGNAKRKRDSAQPQGRHDRWVRILIEAAKQSKHYYLPVMDAPRTFDETISIAAASKIMFTEREGGPLKPALSGSPVLYLVGPEGGWTDGELALARKAGFRLVSLGKGILKAETAAIVGGALIRYEMG
jgi:16S rRNA (uracil1498-N3)-methyltransferase